MPQRSMFRADIQGLRAVAVGLVILAHAGSVRFAGGYIGVDVFFVISGFLIIGLLVGEADRTGHISIADFYVRRARRILPAATLVLVTTVVVTALTLPFLRSVEIFKDAIWASLFGANIRFGRTETDYFATDEPPSLLQHYWSLSIEEQFYIVIPVLLSVILVLSARRRIHDTTSFPHTRRWVLGVVGAVTAASFVWSVLLTRDDPTAAYFSTFTRVWELGVGGLLGAALWQRRVRVNPVVAAIVAAAGLGLIAWATLTYTPATPFPGTAALVPVLGAAAVLAAGSTIGGDRSPTTRVLALAPIRITGDWSYSLYLWHFPVFRLAVELWGPLDRPRALAALVVVFVLSGLTYHLVEEPFRRGQVWKRRRHALPLYPISVALVAVVALTANAWVGHELRDMSSAPAITIDDTSGSPADKVIALVAASVAAAQESRPIPRNLEPPLGEVRQSIAPLGECDYRTGTTRLCPTGDPDADRSIVVFGDSHARHWGPTFDAIGSRYGYRVYLLALTGCPANEATRLDPETGREWVACSEFKQWALRTIADLHPAITVVSNSAYRGSRMAKEQMDGQAALFKDLAPLTDRTVMVGNTPRLPRIPGVCLSTRGANLGTCLMRADPTEQRLQADYAEFARASGVTFIDAQSWFCLDSQCPSVIGAFIPIRDKDHVTVPYARFLAEPMAAALSLDHSSHSD